VHDCDMTANIITSELDRDKVAIGNIGPITNRKSRQTFRLPMSTMTLDDPERSFSQKHYVFVIIIIVIITVIIIIMRIYKYDVSQ